MGDSRRILVIILSKYLGYRGGGYLMRDVGILRLKKTILKSINLAVRKLY